MSSRNPLINWRSKLGLNRGGGDVVTESQTQQRNINNVVQAQGQVPVPVGSGVTNVKREERHTSTSAGRSKVRLAASRRGVSADSGSGLPPTSSSSTAVHSTFKPLNVVSSGLRYITSRSTITDVAHRVTVANNDDKKLVTVTCVRTSSDCKSPSPTTASGRSVENDPGLFGRPLQSFTAGQCTSPETHKNPLPVVDGPAISSSRLVSQCSSGGDKSVATYRNHVDSMTITSETTRRSNSGSRPTPPGLETSDSKRGLAFLVFECYPLSLISYRS